VSENKELGGILFRNERKTPGSKQPDHKGSCRIGGVEYEIGAWINESKKPGGSKFFGLKFQAKTDYAASDDKRKRAAAGERVADVEIDDSSIPF